MGQKFLWESEIACEKREVVPELAIGDPKVRRAYILATHAISSCQLERRSRFSSWDRAVRALARLRCLAQKRRNAEDGLTSVKERRDTELFIISEVQRSVYSEEIRTMREKTELKSNSQLRGLDPFVDDDGIFRVGGRLPCYSLSLEVRCPIVLPRSGHVTSLIIGHHHAATQRQGRGITLHELRANGLWIMRGSKTVAAYISRCVRCRRMRGQVGEQKMANLPEKRVEPSPLSTFCGIGCFGPFLVKDGRKEHKRYGLLACMSSRAVVFHSD